MWIIRNEQKDYASKQHKDESFVDTVERTLNKLLAESIHKYEESFREPQPQSKRSPAAINTIWNAQKKK